MSIESKVDIKIQTLERAQSNGVTSVSDTIKLLSLMRNNPEFANEVLNRGLSELNGTNKADAIKGMRVALDFIELQ